MILFLSGLSIGIVVGVAWKDAFDLLVSALKRKG